MADSSTTEQRSGAERHQLIEAPQRNFASARLPTTHSFHRVRAKKILLF